MEPKVRRQLVVLGALLLVFGYVLVARVVPGLVGPATAPATQPARAAGGAAAGRRPGSAGTAAAELAARARDVDLARLTAPHASPDVSERNPFRFGSGRPAPGSPAADAGPRRPRTEAPATPVAMEMPVQPSGPPPPPPIPYKFIGVVTLAGQTARVAVLSDARGVYHGKEGDLVEGQFRIVRIGEESIQMEYMDGRGRQTIRLSGS